MEGKNIRINIIGSGKVNSDQTATQLGVGRWVHGLYGLLGHGFGELGECFVIGLLLYQLKLILSV